MTIKYFIQIFSFHIIHISSVKVTINKGNPTRFINENDEGAIILPCQFTPDNPGRFKECQEKGRDDCYLVKWQAKGLELGNNYFQTIARPTSENQPILEDYRARFELFPQYDLKLISPIQQSVYNATYKCIVDIDTDNINSAEATFDLFIRVPPTDVQITGTSEPVEKKDSTLQCSVRRAAPYPQFEWYLNDNKITFPNVATQEVGDFTISDDSSELTLNSVTSSKHKGRYTCKAINDAGQSQSQTFTVDPASLDPIILVGSIAGLVIVIIIFTIILACCCCRKPKDPTIKRDFNNPRKGVHAVTSTGRINTPMVQNYKVGQQEIDNFSEAYNRGGHTFNGHVGRSMQEANALSCQIYDGGFNNGNSPTSQNFTFQKNYTQDSDYHSNTAQSNQKLLADTLNRQYDPNNTASVSVGNYGNLNYSKQHGYH